MNARVGEGLRNRDRWRIPHVIGVRFEGQAQESDLFPTRVVQPANRVEHLAAHRALAALVRLNHRLNDPGGAVVILRRLEQRERIFREA